MPTARPFTPDTLAARWDCSAETVRQLFKRGALRGFRVGRMIRIPADAVEEYECQTSASEGCAADTASTGLNPQAKDAAINLRHAPERKRRRKAATDT
ncbi:MULTISPECIES: helix-turn-helix domain-containing protein [unclassified Marinovum]|uniref:helix-turn-helix domain-containing protein n=1 Tax=unclassified Marinovum TaxID=2647166 RepID=UPI003EDBED9E